MVPTLPKSLFKIMCPFTCLNHFFFLALSCFVPEQDALGSLATFTVYSSNPLQCKKIPSKFRGLKQ